MSRFYNTTKKSVGGVEPLNPPAVGDLAGIERQLSTLSAQELKHFVQHILGRGLTLRHGDDPLGAEVRACIYDADRNVEWTTAAGGLASWQITKVRKHVLDHLATGLRIDELAALCRLSVSQFHRSFKQTTGVSPYAFIQRERMRMACDLLRETDLPLSHIALDCGMSDQSHLSNVFRRHTGTTPYSWRRQHRRTPEMVMHEPRATVQSREFLTVVK